MNNSFFSFISPENFVPKVIVFFEIIKEKQQKITEGTSCACAKSLLKQARERHLATTEKMFIFAREFRKR